LDPYEQQTEHDAEQYAVDMRLLSVGLSAEQQQQMWQLLNEQRAAQDAFWQQQILEHELQDQDDFDAAGDDDAAGEDAAGEGDEDIGWPWGLEGEQQQQHRLDQHQQQQQQGSQTAVRQPSEQDLVRLRSFRKLAADLQRLRDRPLFEGCRVSCALEAHLLLFNWRCKYAIKNRAVDELLALLADRILPSGNILARSLHLLRKVRLDTSTALLLIMPSGCSGAWCGFAHIQGFPALGSTFSQCRTVCCELAQCAHGDSCSLT
jgi:hypothetical protein